MRQIAGGLTIGIFLWEFYLVDLWCSTFYRWSAFLGAVVTETIYYSDYQLSSVISHSMFVNQLQNYFLFLWYRNCDGSALFINPMIHQEYFPIWLGSHRKLFVWNLSPELVHSYTGNLILTYQIYSIYTEYFCTFVSKIHLGNDNVSNSLHYPQHRSHVNVLVVWLSGQWGNKITTHTSENVCQ